MNQPILSLEQLSKRFGETEIIRGASLEVRPGERLAIIGPNGAGKSTLFHLISGRLQPSGGRILLNGAPIDGLKPYQVYRRGLARSFQISNLFDHLSVRDNLRCALMWTSGVRYNFWTALNLLRGINQQADALLEELGLQRVAHMLAGALTYAEQRALEIGIAIAGKPAVLLLDEPTAGMSRSESDAAVALIRKVSEGRTLLMVEHDMDVVFGLADRIAVLVYGEIIACDTPEAIRANPAVRAAYLGNEEG